jgi:hypothetical protein
MKLTHTGAVYVLEKFHASAIVSDPPDLRQAAYFDCGYFDNGENRCEHEQRLKSKKKKKRDYKYRQVLQHMIILVIKHT